jgi:hypothetical protein
MKGRKSLQSIISDTFFLLYNLLYLLFLCVIDCTNKNLKKYRTFLLSINNSKNQNILKSISYIENDNSHIWWKFQAFVVILFIFFES